MSNIALIMLQLPDLGGGGGAERFFADFFETYNNQSAPTHNLYFITDDPAQLQKVGYLKTHPEKILRLKNHRFFIYSRIPWIQKIAAKVVGNYLLSRQLKKIIRDKQIDLLHITLYEKRDLELYKAVDTMSKNIRPKLVLNIVDCRIPYMYYTGEFFSSSKKFYESLFKEVRLDAIYSWYQKFEEFARQEHIVPLQTSIVSIRSRYAPFEVASQVPDKKKQIMVWASRMDLQKDPMFFLQALRILKQLASPTVFSAWKFTMYGKGTMLDEVAKWIKDQKLEDVVQMKLAGNLSEVYAESMCYISTQNYENFPSLSMAEAMSKGNAVIAKNVGQTNLFLKDKVNGFLTDPENPRSMAESMLAYMNLSATERMNFAAESMRLMREVHTKENFIQQTDSFYSQVLSST